MAQLQIKLNHPFKYVTQMPMIYPPLESQQKKESPFESQVDVGECEVVCVLKGTVEEVMSR